MNFQNPKFVLIAIATLFVTPLLVALLMQSKLWNFQPSEFVNQGILVDPPQPFAFDGLHKLPDRSENTRPRERKWLLLFPFDSNCDQPCLSTIEKLRQIHLATGRKQARVGIVLLASDLISKELQQRIMGIYPSFELFVDESGESSRKLFDLISEIKTAEIQYPAGQAFLLDPDDNIILRYDPGFDPSDLSQDLDRLLTWSGTD